MTTRVEITFCGLCLFVQGTGKDGKPCLHVLLPVTKDMPKMGMRKHLPRVVYSLDYEAKANESQPVQAGVVSNVERVIDLNGDIIDWSEFVKSGPMPVALPRELANISVLSRFQVKAGEGRIATKFLAASLPSADNCAGRFTLPANVQISPYNFADLDIEVVGEDGGTTKQPIRVAACASCVVETDAPALPLGTLKQDLKPCSGMIRVTIANMIAGDYSHPPEPFSSQNETHFAAFYGLMVRAPQNPPIPRPKKSTQGSLGVDPLTCMHAAGCIDSDAC